MTSINTTNGPMPISSISYKSPDGVISAEMGRMSEGYDSTTSMLNSGWFQVAHRGGSKDYSEHSQQGYTNSLFRGYRAMEVALATSSDGVLFLMHDASLLRTSGLNQSARTTPWATIKDLFITKPNTSVAGATNRPYMTFEKYLDTFGKHSVSLIDTKYLYPADRVVMRSMITNAGTLSKTMGKVVLGDSSTYTNGASLAQEWKNFGVPVAGLFYAINQPDFATLDPTYDVFGMEYTASQAVWDSLRNTNSSKKIIGHIAPDTASVMVAKTKGADGCICSSPMKTPVLLPN